jgi:thiol:disulfide interchange protein DsbD
MTRNDLEVMTMPHRARDRRRLGLWAIPWVLALTGLALALSYGPVEYRVTGPDAPVAPGQRFAVHVDFAVGEGMHLYEDETRIEWTSLRGAKPDGPLVKPKPSAIADPTDPLKTIQVFSGRFRVTAPFVVTEDTAQGVEIRGTLRFQGCTDTMCYEPAGIPFSVTPGATRATPSAGTASVQATVRKPGILRDLVGLVLAFGVGVGIGLTPCVLPMVPVTSAVILRLSRRRGWVASLLLSMSYVLGLAVVYAVAGLLAAHLGAQVQNFLNSAWIRVPIAGLFVALALSMFDVIVIQTPAGIQGKVGLMASGAAASAPGGRPPVSAFAAALGIGMASGLVAGPCVAAPLMGILVQIAARGDPLHGFLTLFVLAWGMGLPLIAAGTAPQLVPKAGAWMTWIKKLFGFLLLWAALYFLANAVGEATYHLLTGVLIVVAVVFLGCFDQLTPQSGNWPRLLRALGIVGLAAAVGLGAAGAASLLGWTPGVSGRPVSAFRQADADEVRAARASGRPVVLDFWASYCAICKQIEKTMLTLPDVRQALEGVHALKVDVERSPELAREFRVPGVPMFVFIDANGKERADLRCGAPASPADLKERVEKLKSGRLDAAPPLTPEGR